MKKSEIIHNITLLKLPLLTHAVENSLLALLRVQLLYSHQKYSYQPTPNCIVTFKESEFFLSIHFYRM